MVELWDDRAVQVYPNTGIRVDPPGACNSDCVGKKDYAELIAAVVRSAASAGLCSPDLQPPHADVLRLCEALGQKSRRNEQVGA